MAAGQTEVASMVARLSLDTSKYEEQTKKTDGFFKKLTESIVKANLATKALSAGFSAVTGVIGVAFQAISSVVKGSMDAYKEFEQLSGGAELMFGEAFDFIEQRSKEAWKSAGLSQNEYLQQVNGLATGLKTALGGDEMAAAELADRVISAQADVVAATGQSKDAVQNAFNGIMKSNYTMLDNLQLGIKPTKEGFQEVIDKVNEWNAANGKATNYQIDNLADAQNALADYIEMQGLAGYAASEAAGTIEGSWASLKASWANTLTALGSGSAEEVTNALSNLGDAVTTWLLNIGPRLAIILGSIGDMLPGAIQSIGEKVTQAFPSLIPKFIAGGIKLMVGLVKGVVTGAKLLWTLIGELWTQLQNFFSGMDLKTIGSNLMQALWDGIQSTWFGFIAWVEEKVGDLLAMIERFINDKIKSLADLPIIKDLFPGLQNVNVNLGSADLYTRSANHKQQSADLKAQKTVLMGAVTSGLTEFKTSVMDKCDELLDGQDVVAGTVKHGDDNIVAAINGDGTGTDGAGGYTLEDQIDDMMRTWYTEYANGIYDYSLLESMNGSLAQLNQYGIYTDPAAILNTGIFPEEMRAAARRIQGDPEYATQDEQFKFVNGILLAKAAVDSVDTSVGDLQTAVENQELIGEGETLGVTVDNSEALSVTDADVSDAISKLDLSVTNNITVNVPTIDVPAAEVTVTTEVSYDTTILDTTATTISAELGAEGAAGALSTAGSDLGTEGAAGALTTAAGSLVGGMFSPDALEQNNLPTDPMELAEMFASGSVDPIQMFSLNVNAQMNGQDQSALSSASGIEPIPADTIQSYRDFATAVGDVTAAFMGEGAGEGESAGGLVGALTTVRTKLNDVLTYSVAVASYFEKTFPGAIDALMRHVCMTDVDPEGNIDATGGNTLYTGWGWIHVLFQDIYNDSVLIAEYWTGTFVDASETLRNCGAANTVMGMAHAASDAVLSYNALAASIYGVIDALLELRRIKGGKGGRTEAATHTDLFKAAGGPVSRGGTYIVGEEGPELFTPSRSGYIVPSDELNGGNGPSITVNVGNVYGESYLQDYVIGLLTGEIRKELRLAA